MASTYTTNKLIEKPGNGDYANTWNVPVNADWDIIDKAFGGVTSLNVTAVSGTVTLTSTQYQALILSITGTLTANVTYEIPSGKGGQWIVANATTGAFTVTISSGGGGTSTVATQGYNSVIYCDSTNTALANSRPASAPGSDTYVVYNSGGSLAAESALVWDYTNNRLGINQAAPAYALDVTGSINATAQVRVGTSIRFSDATTQSVSAQTMELVVVFSGGSSTIATGIAGDFQAAFAFTITEWTLLGDQSGSIQIGIWKDVYASFPPTVADSIVASAPPLISAATKGNSSTLTGWTTSVAAGDCLRFNIDSVTSLTRCTLVIKGTRA
jgi:hypothetical protein